MNILGTVLSYIYSNFNPFNYIPQNFNPVDTKFIKGNDVAYGLNYQDNNDGTSEVKLITSLLSKKNKSVTHNTGIRIPSALKGQLSLSLLKNPAGIDRVGIVFPEEATNKQGKKYQRLSFNTYEIEHSANASSINLLDSAKLQWHINGGNPANIGNSYSDPQVVTLDGDVGVTAKNSKDKTLASWYLKSDKNGKFKALAGEKGVTERKLLKLSNTGNQFVLNGNTLLSSQVDKKIIGNQAVKTTDFFTSNMAGVFQSLKKGKGINECLLGKHCQINEKPFFSSEHEISFLQYVERGEGDIVAFLEKDKSSNKQRLSLIIFKDSTLLAYDTSIYEFEDSIEQLYVKDNGQGDVIVTAVSGENIITFIQKSSEMPSKATVIPASSITSLSDFVHIVNGELMPDITSTVTPITVTEAAVTSESTFPTSISGSNSQPPTAVASESTSPTSISDSSSQPSSVATDKGYSNSTESTTPNSTTEKVKKVTELATTSTNAPTTQTVLTIQSTTKGISTEQPATSIVTTPGESQSSSSPKPHELSSENPIAPTTPLSLQSSSSSKPDELSSAGIGGSNSAVVALLIAVGVITAAGLTGYGGYKGYKCVQNYRDKNAAPSDVEASSAQADNVSCGGDSVHEFDYAQQKGPGLLSSILSRLSRVRSWFGRNKPNVDEELNNLVRNSSSHSLGSDNTHTVFEPTRDNGQNNRHTGLRGVSVVGSSPVRSESPGSSGRSSPRI